MIIGITGHTAGIGKSSLTAFEKNNHTVFGFNKWKF
jgi:NADP-dependent 3-hydroxy acid dehydrogenase YdfG